MSEKHDKFERIARRYTRFAADEARGQSPAYEALALAVADSPDILAFLAALPAEKRQPNLFLAAVRHIAGVPVDGKTLAEMVAHRAEHIREVMLSRSTQTNEPGRCAVLLPLLARLP